MKPDLSRLPAVGRLVQDPRLADLPAPLVVEAARAVVADLRGRLLAGEPLPDDVVAQVRARAEARGALRLRRVINATGVVLHTNLGRAPLGARAAAAVAAVAQGYSNAELDLETGLRGGRLAGVVGPLRALTGAEAAIAVNNGAAAVLLALTALAAGREVIVSRGELVEIGGSFRVPEVVSAGGARLVEVGSTNRTRVGDYAAAITANTALLMRVHPSNFRQIGFTERPDRAGLVALGRERGVPVVEDLGSGLFGALPFGDEESVPAVLAAGVDLVCFSGDKLLGGPQAGIIAGKAALVERLARHPLYRSLRLDKLVLAALEATLRSYEAGEGDALPVRQMLLAPLEQLRARAEALADLLPGSVVEADEAPTGGGALPGQPRPTWTVALPGYPAEALMAALRGGRVPVVARASRGAVRLDLRAVLPGEEAELALLVARALAGLRGDG
jgi:L-seryl-tRNA(Ser) seleniumtransferase